MAQQTELTWYKAKLLPTANSIFTNSFYPTENDIPGEVYCAITAITPAHARVIIASRMHESSVRMMTPHLASHCLDIKHPVSKKENDQLNSLTINMMGKISQE
jgi:hypothetical protein